MEKSAFWFPAKRYGWGWGVPTAWQGRAVLLAFVALVAVSAFVFFPGVHTGAFVLCIALLCLALFAICTAKGEPAALRWGK